MIEYTLKIMLLVVLMLLHDSGLHLYIVLALFCCCFPPLEMLGQQFDIKLKDYRAKQAQQ